MFPIKLNERQTIIKKTFCDLERKEMKSPICKGTSTIKICCGKKKKHKHDSIKVKNQHNKSKR